MAAIAPAPLQSVSPVRNGAPPVPPSASTLKPLIFEHAPGLYAAVLFASGIFCVHLCWRLPALLLLGLALSACVALAAVRLAPRVAAVPVLAVWFTLGLLCAEIEPAADPQMQLRMLADGAQRSVEGEIIRLGPLRIEQSSAPYSNRVRVEHAQPLDLRVHSVDGATVSGGLRLTLYAPADAAFPMLQCGDTLHAILAIHEPERYLDPGVWDSTAYLRQQGIGVLASAKADSIGVERAARRPLFSCWLHGIQQNASGRLIAFADAPSPRLPGFLRLSHDDAAMLSAMITGDRAWLERRVRVGFERTGSFHLLVVSGLHLAIFAGLIFWIAQKMRMPRVAATALTLAAAFAYALFTGFGQPVQRSFWMVALYLLGRLLWRQKSALNAIGFAALGLLVAHPSALFDAGFQMTLLSVLATGGIAAPVAERTFAPYLHGMRGLAITGIDPSLPPRVAQFRVVLRLIAEHLRPLTGRWLAWSAFPASVRIVLRGLELLVVSVSIEAIMVLPMAIYFHRITVLALPVNVLVVPMIAFLLPAALLTFATLLAVPALAWVPAALTATMLHCVTAFIHFFSSMRSADLRLPDPAWWQTAVWIVLLAMAIWSLRRSRLWMLGGVAALVAGAAVAVWPRPLEHSHALEITAIDVGQGDSLLLVTPEGKTLLIDGGGTVGASPDSRFDIGEEVVSAFLWNRGIRRLDAVALTHAHADHIGGLPAVFANFRPRQLWLGRNPDAAVVRSLLADAAAVGTSVEHFVAGDAFSFGGIDVRVLAPDAGYQPGDAPSNNDSLVLKVAYGQTAALLEGDAEAPSEASMVRHGGLRADLLKVGHHGSRTSTTPDFLSAVAPEYSVVSVGHRNLYGLPRREVLEELEKARVRTYRTDSLGADLFVLDGTRVVARPLASIR